MDDTRRGFDSVPESALLCDRVSHQIIGMTFGEEKEYIKKAPKKQGSEQKTEKQADKPGELDQQQPD